MQKWFPILVAVFLTAIVVWGWLSLPRWWGGGSKVTFYDTPALLRQVQTLSHLVTVKYVLEKVVILEDVKWYGESRVLLLAHGVVKAGVDLDQLAPQDLMVTEKKIVVRLPAARITDAYLDDNETKIIERTTGLLRAFDKTLEQTARQQAVDDLQRAARHGGILKEAEERAQMELAGFFHQLGFESVEFRAGGLRPHPPG